MVSKKTASLKFTFETFGFAEMSAVISSPRKKKIMKK